jgi:P4 family phage/plasmid primase-like protien
MKQGGLNIGTLRMWAKNDNPEKYQEFINTDLSDLLYISRSKTHHDIAKVVHHLFQHQFVCSSAKGRSWFEFKKHRWILVDQGISLRMKLSDDVWKVYKQEADKFNRLSLSANNPTDQDNYHETVKVYLDICTKLRTTTFKENVMKECAELFYIDKFEEKLDSDHNLICFENGVYDLEEHKFRDGRPEDYLSFSTGVNYSPYDPKNETVQAIQEYLSQVLVKRGVREYVLKLFSTFLSGNVKEQKFYIWTGSGSNSKSKLIELFERSFGDYCCKFPITLLTQKRVASNAANTELARAKGKRFACLQEPSDDEKINIGLMKELSGGDKIMARALYKEPIEFSPQFKMLLLCNHLPYVPSDDGGTWRRIRVVEFTSKFVEEPIEPNEFPIDYNLSEKMECWGESFMSMLIHYYKLYELEGISEPYDVVKCTHEYKLSNDHLSAFVSNKIEKKENAFLTVEEIHTELRNWIKDDNIPIKLPSKPDFEKYIHKNICKITTVNHAKGIKGYRIKSYLNEEEEILN